MKRILSIALVVGLGLLLVSGCQQATTSSPVSSQEAAGDCAQLTDLGLYTDNLVLLSLGATTGFRAQTVSGIVRTSDGWWYLINSSTGQQWDIYFKLWDQNGQELTTLASLSAWKAGSVQIDKISTYTTLALTSGSETLNLSMGASKSDPLTFSGRVNPPQKLDGPISMSGTADGKNYSVVIDYVNVSLNTDGYPSGSVNFSVLVDSSTVLAGTITYDGDETATLTFTSGAEGAYTINIETHQVS
jgi:hypothetical protein